jgi:3-methylcrotonyl-CoA carboxylase alpha subunit
MTRIGTLLVANRGEIAVRVMRTAKRMGIHTVAVYSDADSASLHVAAADVALRVGGARAAESYLDGGAILAAARESGADAIHPGYGFLAENADFAEHCEKGGFVFVGPSPAAMRAMGDKSGARRRVAAAGVPIVGGYDGADQDMPALRAAAAAVGYPLMIKAVAGGGGKGMRVVASEAELEASIAAAKREAKAAFGDDRVLIETYLTNPRHVEVQVFGDRAGHVVHLFERDCSIQRRYQKVIEEAPAPGLSEDFLAALREAALTSARAVNYIGAGTVEFLVAGSTFYFMEMNTRLQVEHPVTEAITGLDLVEWQIRVAAGEDLPLPQEAITATGHAIEARLSAEDPDRGFLPQTGRFRHLRLPEGLDGIRVDTGVREGDEVSVHYDPLIAKIIATGRDRPEAIRRLEAAISASEIVGVTTNRDFLRAALAHPAFAAGDVDTGFIARHGDRLLAKDARLDGRVLAVAALATLRVMERADAAGLDPADPWARTDGWRLGGRASARLQLGFGGETIPFDVTQVDGRYALRWPGGDAVVGGDIGRDGAITATVGTADTEVRLKATAVIDGDRVVLFVDGREYVFEIIDPRRARRADEAAKGHLTSPMPGIVVLVAASAGETVKKGTPLVVVEAMKMEHAIAAPRDGRIGAVKVAVGDKVAAGAELVVMEDEA